MHRLRRLKPNIGKTTPDRASLSGVVVFARSLINKKSCNRNGCRIFWSCYPDSDRGPHPYQPIFDDFYNNFRLFLVVFVPNNVVSRTFEKCSLRCFHICLWWNCGQAAILRIRPLIVRNHIRCISISYSPEFFTLYTAFFRQYIIECL